MAEVTSNDIPVGYSLTTAIDTTGYITSTYPWGQCTWYVFNRGKQVGVNFDPFMGNGGQWMNKPGFNNNPYTNRTLCSIIQSWTSWS